MATDLLIIAVLVCINAAFAGTELAVVSLRRSQLLRLAEEHGRRGRILLELSEQPTRFLSTIQVGITLAGFLASATAAVALAEPLEPLLEPLLGNAAAGTALILVTLALTFVTLVFGELVPKRVAMRRPERWALFAAPPVAFIARIARPLVWLLARSTDVVARLVGGGPATDSGLMSDREVLDVIASEADITPARRAFVEGALELQQRSVREVLVPRRDVDVLDSGLTVGEAAKALATTGHSRAPVGDEGQLETVHGVVLLASLVVHHRQDDPVVTACLDPVVVPEEAHVQDVLMLLQRSRRQMALVADEHGSYVGIVTVEDLLEEIVGELYDELDRDLDPDDPRGYERASDGSFELPGTFPVHDLEDLGMPVPEDTGAATVAGLLLDALERLPVDGEQAAVGELLVTAVKVEGTVIELVRIRRT
jgi:putative hemolysin